MVTAFILANTRTGKEREVLESIMGLPQVREAHNVYGDYDVFMKAEAETLDKLNDFLLKEVRRVGNITTTTTLVGL